MRLNKLLAFMETAGAISKREMGQVLGLSGIYLDSTLHKLYTKGVIERVEIGVYRLLDEPLFADPKPMPPNPPALTWETMFAWVR